MDRTSEARDIASAQSAIERLHVEIAELRNSRRRLVFAADADRRALERQLHDGLQQLLVALAVEAQRAAGVIAADPAAAEAALAEVRAGLQSAVDEAAQLAERIHPPLLEAGGLVPALRGAAARAGVSATVAVVLRSSHPAELAAAAYWCCLDALALAPAGAHVAIDVRDTDEALAFEVVGPQDAAGLDRLRDRVEALGGRLATHSEPDGRVRLAGTLPVSQ